jgi:hypothetical protein
MSTCTSGSRYLKKVNLKLVQDEDLTECPIGPVDDVEDEEHEREEVEEEAVHVGQSLRLFDAGNLLFPLVDFRTLFSTVCKTILRL